MADYNSAMPDAKKMITTLPAVTVIIPTFNEESFIVECINSLVDGNYPLERMELLVVDGHSNDQTQKKVLDLAAEHGIIKLLQNPKRIVPAAVNVAIAAATHDILVWVGAHAIYDADYLVNSVKVLVEEDCASAGGIITPVGKSIVGKAIAAATASAFGVGKPKYRHADKRQAVDTVFGGCWRKENIVKIGGFNEQWVRNQDYELNCRLRELVGEIILDPGIRCQYYCRESIPALARQYYDYGYWRFRTFLKHPESFTTRQAAPLLLFAGILISPALSYFNPVLASLVPLTYGLALISVGAMLSVKHRQPLYAFLLPVIFATLHLCWAVGFIKSGLQNLFTGFYATDKRHP
ncbi:MAG: glycosyltransferase [Gammaproteobacteria bacterium]|nr:glycosyltransferase [Gammaproteobacteria bacterium]